MTFLVFDLASRSSTRTSMRIATYVKRLPSDMAVTFFHAATARDTLVDAGIHRVRGHQPDLADGSGGRKGKN